MTLVICQLSFLSSESSNSSSFQWSLELPPTNTESITIIYEHSSNETIPNVFWSISKQRADGLFSSRCFSDSTALTSLTIPKTIRTASPMCNLLLLLQHFFHRRICLPIISKFPNVGKHLSTFPTLGTTTMITQGDPSQRCRWCHFLESCWTFQLLPGGSSGIRFCCTNDLHFRYLLPLAQSSRAARIMQKCTSADYTHFLVFLNHYVHTSHLIPRTSIRWGL